MKISLITTLFNEEANVLKFLESFSNQTKLPDEFIIVDGGSDDNTVKIIEKFSHENPHLKIKLIIDPTCSRKYSISPVAKGRNVAIRNTNSQIIAATDAGCSLTPNWFEEITRHLITTNVDIIVGKNKFIINNEFQRIYEKFALNEKLVQPSSRNIAFKKKIWEKVDGYPETSLTAEDTLFNIRCKKAGARFYFNQDAIIMWEAPQNVKELKQKQIGYGCGDGINKLFLLKYVLRFCLIFFPINVLLKSGFSATSFKIGYLHMVYYQIGYTKGLFNGHC